MIFDIQFFIVIIVISFALGILCWLFFNHGIDKIKHPEEWKDAGSSGERVLYNALIKKFYVPEEQIFRNVYIPAKNGTTSEIDLIVVSKKGLFVFECKNYGGRIYGDAKYNEWLQYIGSKKESFYNPLLQNKTHVKILKELLEKNDIRIPIVPLVSVTSRGEWKVRNLGDEDYILGVNCHFGTIYHAMPDLERMSECFKPIIGILSRYSRPDSSIREEHIVSIRKKDRRTKRIR
ncbi:NERD domain-containing protein [Candidatus Saccharibacteria bacterium]|nr:NERD domain-containing protein [Candidatus Saccharibacteria bacterium]